MALLNLSVVVKIARVLVLASSRAKNRDSTKLSGGATNAILGGIFLLGSALAAYLIANETGIDSATLGVYLSQFLVVLPSMTMFFCLVYGILFEFNQSVFNVSMDAINWLPISAADYVLGSTLCTLYYSSPILAILIGATLGISVLAGTLWAWLLTLALSIFGALIGGFSMELIRVAFNRASSSISKRSGSTAMFGRLVISILMIAVFSSIYNFNVILKVTEWFTSVAGAGWFFPLIWPSLAIISLLRLDVVGVTLYLALSIMLTGAFFYAGARARAANWSPEPVTISFNSTPGKMKAPDARLHGLTTAESALVRKDLRGLLRRREMVSFLAFPFIMVLINLLNGTFDESFAPGTALSTRIMFFAFPGFGVLLLSFYVAAVGIGSEGSGFINLLSAPVSASEIARAKILTALIPAIPGLAIIVAAVAFILDLSPLLLAFITVFGLTTIVESAVVGLAVGTHFADYTEVPRARFVSPTGMLVGMVALAAVVGVTYGAPQLLDRLDFGAWRWVINAVAVATMGITLSFLAYRFAVSEVQKAYESAPI
ncbi:TPA: hypothetical protein HA344_07335 [Candidatus Bathyarchaeota archaeon]|nr:hypothetical protein [Candidatus Bathyarchaeota archaeon]